MVGGFTAADLNGAPAGNSKSTFCCTLLIKLANTKSIATANFMKFASARNRPLGLVTITGGLPSLTPPPSL